MEGHGRPSIRFSFKITKRILTKFDTGVWAKVCRGEFHFNPYRSIKFPTLHETQIEIYHRIQKSST